MDLWKTKMTRISSVTLTREQVDAFRENDRVNPITRREIKPGKRVHTMLSRACAEFEATYELTLALMSGVTIREGKEVDDNFSVSMISSAEAAELDEMDAMSVSD